MNDRSAGILLPITALPSPYGVGTLGADARRFVDFLHEAGQRIWQVLPLVPTGYGDSPYSSTSATAGSPYLIDIEALIDEGLLTYDEADKYSCDGENSRIDYEALFYKRIPLLKLAFGRFDKKNLDFIAFVKSEEYADFALFMALKEAHGWRAQSLWEEKYRAKDENAINEFIRENESEILFWQFTQYEFFRQWHSLKAYANEREIQIMGDMPLYVSDDSAEVWAHPELFLLDEKGYPTDVAGVPPDYFSQNGQLWGNPLYNWERMSEDGYAWWTARLKKALSMYDAVRIDHFRGFDRFYAVPNGSPDARVGEWRDGPKEELFKDKLDWNIVAEDLGTLDEGVHRLMKNTGYPGMKIIEFAFNGDPNHEYKPSNCGENCIIYTGTHDNATFMEFISDMDSEARASFYRELATECERFKIKFEPSESRGSDENIKVALDAVICVAYKSRARCVILPMQDVLCTGAGTRMNVPGTLGKHNWSWRCDKNSFSKRLAKKIRKLTEDGGR